MKVWMRKGIPKDLNRGTIYLRKQNLHSNEFSWRRRVRMGDEKDRKIYLFIQLVYMYVSHYRLIQKEINLKVETRVLPSIHFPKQLFVCAMTLISNIQRSFYLSFILRISLYIWNQSHSTDKKLFGEMDWWQYSCFNL